MNATSSAGRPATARTLIAAPDTTKKHRNKESVADAFQFHFQRLAAVGDDVTQDEACGERAEHRVKFEQCRNGDKEDEQECGQSHERLR